MAHPGEFPSTLADGGFADLVLFVHLHLLLFFRRMRRFFLCFSFAFVFFAGVAHGEITFCGWLKYIDRVVVYHIKIAGGDLYWRSDGCRKTKSPARGFCGLSDVAQPGLTANAPMARGQGVHRLCVDFSHDFFGVGHLLLVLEFPLFLEGVGGLLFVFVLAFVSFAGV